ncbi:hypothetical protein LDENG_00052230 [Lucifuga dentata]|nr:hypothetical protein LDENG_00052230 [Lucifuga dentata]
METRPQDHAVAQHLQPPRSSPKAVCKKTEAQKESWHPTRLKANCTGPALPSVLLSNICSLDNKLDHLRLLLTRREVKHCCAFIFTEMWLHGNIPDSAIQLNGLALFCSDWIASLSSKKYGGDLCVYISKECLQTSQRHVRPVLREVRTWSQGATSTLQDCYENKDWTVFKEAATDSGSVDLEEYTSSVTGYISKCTDDVTTSKTIITRANQKPWFTAEVQTLVKARDAAFKSGDREALSKIRAGLSQAIRAAKCNYDQKIHGHFSNSRDMGMW